MFLRLEWLLLFHITICMASPFPATPTASAIPKPLRASIPECAWSCLATYIKNNFPRRICFDSNDIDCLCSHNGIQGFTLSEGAFVCTHQNCNGQSGAVINSTYNICDGRPGAVSATHALLPVSVTAPPSLSASDIIIASTTLSETSQISSTSTSRRATISSDTASANVSHQGLQASQIIGISVACGVAVIVGVLILGFWLCMRRRRRQHERLASDKLPCVEFPTPVAAEGKWTPEPDPRKDPRGGPGGVGIAPIRYKAIPPPANLFPLYQEQPVPARSTQPAKSDDIARPLNTTKDAPGREEIGRTRRKHTTSVLSGVTSIASSHYSLDQPPVPVVGPTQMPPSTAPRRTTSTLARPGLAHLASDRPYSTASQTTQFEEDMMQSPAFAPANVARPTYPAKTDSDQATPSSQEGSCSSSSTTPPAHTHKPQRPSLNINIPGKPYRGFQFPDPPKKIHTAPGQAPQRPTLVGSGAALTQLPLAADTRPPASQAVVQAGLPEILVTTSSPRAQASPAIAAQGPGMHSAARSHERKTSITRRGFSQPYVAAYRNQPDQRITNPARPVVNGSGPLTVNGERINYPSIPKPTPTLLQSPPMYFAHASQPMRQPQAPPDPPVQHVMAGSWEEPLDNAKSLLTKRRGHERALTLEQQLVIPHANSSTATVDQGNMGTAGSAQSFRGAAHGYGHRVVSPQQRGPPSSGMRPPLAPANGWSSPYNGQAQVAPYFPPPPSQRPAYPQQPVYSQRPAAAQTYSTMPAAYGMPPVRNGGSNFFR